MKFEKYFDHTVLKPEAVAQDICKACEEAKQYGFASVCVNGRYAALAKEQLQGTDIAVCVTVGFPLGACGSEVKAFEAQKAIEAGADEIDMVIDIGALKDKDYDRVKEDIQAVRSKCEGKVLKAIIEACLLTDEEKIKACELAVEAGADFVKTSTGFGEGGATLRDVALLYKTADGRAKIKAAGGIRDYNTAEAMIDAGAERLGTSATVKIMQMRD